MATNSGTTTATTPLHTVVGIYRTDQRAIAAVHSLDAAGFAASRVQMVADDPSRAAEVGGKTYAPHGFVLGALFGVVVVAVFTAMGDLGRDAVGLAIGAIGVVGGLAVIGLVIGRTIGRHAPDSHEFADVVGHGGAVVSVRCSGEECDLAVRVLDDAGATAVRDEAGPEAV